MRLIPQRRPLRDHFFQAAPRRILNPSVEKGRAADGDTILVSRNWIRRRGGTHLLKRASSGTWHKRVLIPTSRLLKRRCRNLQADLDDPPSIRRAMHGCLRRFRRNKIFGGLFPRIRSSVNVIDAAAKAGVGHLVLRTLPAPKA